MTISDLQFLAVQTIDCQRAEWSDTRDALRDELEAVKRELHTLQNPPIQSSVTCLGYVELDRPGECRPGTPCVDCGQRIWGSMWVALTNNAGIRGPLCELCAKSD